MNSSTSIFHGLCLLLLLPDFELELLFLEYLLMTNLLFVFSYFHCNDFSWLNKTMKNLPEFRSAMFCCERDSLSRTFISAPKRTFNLAAVQTSV